MGSREVLSVAAGAFFGTTGAVVGFFVGAVSAATYDYWKYPGTHMAGFGSGAIAGLVGAVLGLLVGVPFGVWLILAKRH